MDTIMTTNTLYSTDVRYLAASAVAVSGNPTSWAGYYSDTLPLFSNGATIDDINQGAYGDCVLMACLAGEALRNSPLATSMVQSNGDNTYTVRFYNSKNVATYVRVDNQVSNKAAGAPRYGNAADSWVAIVEKAYAVFNTQELGWANSYDALEGSGGYYRTLHALTNVAPSSYTSWGSSSSSGSWAASCAAVQTAVAQGYIVTYASNMSSTGSNGKTELVSNHMFTVTGYDAATSKFVLRNPWGTRVGGESWNVTFEASATQLYGNGTQTQGGQFVVNDGRGRITSAGSYGSLDLLAQALATNSDSVASATISVAANQGTAGMPLLVASQ